MVRTVAAKYPRPDIVELYRHAVKNRERNPVIIIPGFGGSQLVRRGDSRVAWGTLFDRQNLNHNRPEGLRALAIDLDGLPTPLPQDAIRDLEDDTIAIAPLALFQADAIVTDVSFNVYASLFELLGDAGYISGGEGFNELQYDLDAYNSFTFVYDWRLDGVRNAQALGEFIEAAREEVRQNRQRLGLPEKDEIHFDIVAHSMGGLIARYYLRYGTEDVLDDPSAEVTWAGAADIDRLILISTPNAGAMLVLKDMIESRHRPPMIPAFQASLLVTLPALYQMLPRPRHRLIVDAAGEPVDVDFCDIDVWRENGWGPFSKEQERYLEWLLPEEASTEARRRRVATFMTAAFERAKRFTAALDRPPPSDPPTSVYLFAGDADPTLHRGRLRRDRGRLRLDFDGPALNAPGDGSVTRFSALGDERLGAERTGWLRSPIPWTATFFIGDRHVSFLKNPTLQNNLLHLLLERPPRRDEEE